MPQRRSVFAPKPRDDLSQCKNCGRNFVEDRIEKHETICTKTTQKKRKPFDMTKKRVQGTDAAPYVKNQGTQKPSTNSKVSFLNIFFCLKVNEKEKILKKVRRNCIIQNEERSISRLERKKDSLDLKCSKKNSSKFTKL